MIQEKKQRYINYLLLVALTGFLLSCSQKATIPVVDRSVEAGSNIKNSIHIVEPGDTVFSIAWRYDLDHMQLAANNSIRSPYTIKPGQKIRLDDKVVVRPKTEKKTSWRPSSSSTQTTVTKKPETKPAPKTYRPKSSSQIASANLKWRWPAKGKVISKFSSAGVGNKGIDIAGAEGEPVYAAESGRVVYAGNRLVGYGNLGIIKHNDEYLSAYGHSKVLKVKEGDQVKKGQKIAVIGSSGTNQTKLHFEIRKKGKPVDPMYRLPSRS